MNYIKRNFFLICLYNFYIGTFIYTFLAYNNIFTISKDSVILHMFPFMIIGMISFGYIYEYFKNDEYRVNKTQLSKIIILIIKTYIIMSLIISPLLMCDFIIWKLLFLFLGIGSVTYLFFYFRTNKDFL